ncbi:hypothetical protein HFP57_04775 [Parasphingopyxis algicola]|nr:hypothetical protein HFP57_04775 [Parasphingopyxis algicola]
MRLGFLYNHDEIHQVAHTAPIISCLQALAPELRVDVLTSSDRQRQAVASKLDPSIEPPAFYPLEESKFGTLVEKLTGGVVPLSRIGGLAASLDLLARYDALIVPETTSTLLKTRYGFAKPKLIFLPHGAGDRSISVAPEIANFDFVLLPGEKTKTRMLDAHLVRPGDYAVVGYPKFDAHRSSEPARFFDNDRPVVLYNPHFDPKLSSWFKFGEKLLHHFAGQDRFNLIFAPHVMLFRRKILASAEHLQIRLRRALHKRFANVQNILIDTGSERSVDMSYTRTADIYIGDVSSQIYEFIERPRPAIFLNSHDADWRGDPSYEFWKFGPVIDDIGQLPDTLGRSLEMHGYYRPAQFKAFRKTYSIDPVQSSSERAAVAIVRYLNRIAS